MPKMSWKFLKNPTKSCAVSSSLVALTKPVLKPVPGYYISMTPSYGNFLTYQLGTRPRAYWWGWANYKDSAIHYIGPMSRWKAHSLGKSPLTSCNQVHHSARLLYLLMARPVLVQRRRRDFEKGHYCRREFGLSTIPQSRNRCLVIHPPQKLEINIRLCWNL
jgi:hypothetical protein